MLDAAPSVAGLFQRKFLAVGEPLRLYDQRDLPFSEIRIQPLMTPTIVPEPSESDAFVPYVGGAPFVWILHYLDKEGRPGRLAMPLVWVPAGILDAKIPRPKACSTARIRASCRRTGRRSPTRRFAMEATRSSRPIACGSPGASTRTPGPPPDHASNGRT